MTTTGPDHDPGKGASSVDQLFARWLSRLEDETADPQEEARLVLDEAPVLIRPLLHRQISSVMQLASNVVAGVELAEGARAGDYQLGHILGRGATGVVWSALTSAGEPRAIKFIHALYLASEEGVRRLQREVQAARRVDHVAVNRLRDTVEFGSSVGLVSDRVGDGATLADEISTLEKGGEVANGRRMLERLLPVLRGVAALHEAGVLHLDIKPGNLLLGMNGKLLVSDFGLARLIDQPSATRTFQLLGTPAYMAPEVARGDRRAADNRSDVFSLGVTIYEAVCLQRPFVGTGSQGVLGAVLHDEPAPLPGTPDGLSNRAMARLRAVLSRCLEKEPHRRYPEVGQLADDIEALLQDRPVHGRSLLRRLKVSLSRRKKPALAMALILFLLGITWRDWSLRRDLTNVLTITNSLDEARRPGGSFPERSPLVNLLGKLDGLLSGVSPDLRRETFHRVGALLATRGATTDLAVGAFEHALASAGTDREREPILSDLALLHERRSELEQSVGYYAQAAAALALEVDHNSRLRHALLLAQASSAVTRFNIASENFPPLPVEQVLTIVRKALASTPPDLYPALRARLELKSFELKRWAHDEGTNVQDVETMQALLEQLESIQGEDHPWKIEALCYVGDELTNLQLYTPAKAILGRARALAIRTLGEKHILTQLANLRYGKMLLDSGHPEEAYKLYQSSVAELEKQLGPSNRTVLDYSIGIYAVMETTHRWSGQLEFVGGLIKRGRESLDPSDTVMTLIQRAWVLVCSNFALPDEARSTLANQWQAHLTNFREHRGAALIDIEIAMRIELLYTGSAEDAQQILNRIEFLHANLLEFPPDEAVNWDWRSKLEAGLELSRLLLAAHEGRFELFGRLAESSPSVHPDDVELLRASALARTSRLAGNLDAAGIVLQAAEGLIRPDIDSLGPYARHISVGFRFEQIRLAAARGELESLRVHFKSLPDLQWDQTIQKMNSVVNGLLQEQTGR